MLVLGRRFGQTIRIGPDIEISFIGWVDGKVKVGIQAPANVLILRGELAEKIKADEPAEIKT